MKVIAKVKNAVNTTDNSKNWLEDYFQQKYKTPPFSSMSCPSCGKMMYHKQTLKCDDKSIMVGAHVEWKGILYILPICKECNDKKENLLGFTVEADKLCRI